MHLDSCYHSDPAVAPSVPLFVGGGRIVDRSAPGAIDRELVVATFKDYLRADPPLLVVEGMFALSLSYLEEWVRWWSYVDLPADMRLARKLLRKIDEGHDVSVVLRGYLEHGRAAHQRYVEPSIARADLVIDAMRDMEHQVAQLLCLIR